ncbi:hypothetical protein EDC01DRAFT_508992 [Geopyxis carbonaria]|nr:hypothetical protein EDC01DRAFT_508992 [Geopyxis carbonaria]
MSLPHTLRTAASPRAATLHTATITALFHPTPTLRHLVLSSASPPPFAAGQWLDVHVPGIAQAGGFSLISAPPALELSVQRAPHNPAAARLWAPAEQVVGLEVQLRVGGGFTMPREMPRGVWLCAGVGVNPVLGMVAAGGRGRVLYSARPPWAWVERLVGTEGRVRVELFSTAAGEVPGGAERVWARRMAREDLERVLQEQGGAAAAGVWWFVCGPQGYADWCVETLRGLGVPPERVLCEKWW